jgi:NADH:ubiquinone oxidoreductase subunit K
MKDLHISIRRQKAELKWLAGCFGVAFLLNILSIIVYKTSWSEVFTQLLWVLVITFVLYAVTVGLRVILYIVRRLF